jgi:hypothetical protein
MKSKNDTSTGSKKDRVYAVNENQQGAGKQRANADTQQHARQGSDQQGHQQGGGQTSIGQADRNANAGRDSQQQARQDDNNHQLGSNPSAPKSNQQGSHADDRPRAQDKPQQR